MGGKEWEGKSGRERERVVCTHCDNKLPVMSLVLRYNTVLNLVRYNLLGG